MSRLIVRGARPLLAGAVAVTLVCHVGTRTLTDSAAPAVVERIDVPHQRYQWSPTLGTPAEQPATNSPEDDGAAVGSRRASKRIERCEPAGLAANTGARMPGGRRIGNRVRELGAPSPARSSQTARH